MNWWLVALAFVLGVVLTALFTIRRVTHEAPAHKAPAHEAAAPAREPAVVAPPAAEPVPAATPTAVEVQAPSEPHGPGSARPDADGGGPPGWTVKGNEESKLYHSTESPSHGVTRAEVWFRDAETAEAAGFNRWDSGKSQRGRKPQR